MYLKLIYTSGSDYDPRCGSGGGAGGDSGAGATAGSGGGGTAVRAHQEEKGMQFMSVKRFILYFIVFNKLCIPKVLWQFVWCQKSVFFVKLFALPDFCLKIYGK